MKKIFLIATIAMTACGTNDPQTYYQNKEYQWTGNEIIQGEFCGRALSSTQVTSNYVPLEPRMEVWNDMNPKEINRREWNLTQDISQLPHYESDNVLENALYNMALEESILAIEPDSTFRTGIAWGGVWTRDVSYSIIHSLAQLHPEVSMRSLRAKVTPTGRIIQDTGTGGAWPCSTDRTIWAVAAWEIYKVTGDQEWLDYICPIIRNTLLDDMAVAYDREHNLMRGETSYMDWREQEYPQWMQPADIYSSEATVNNAVHYMAISAMAQICKLKGLDQEAQQWENHASNIREGINQHLWLQDKGYYSIYLYGRTFPILSDQCDAMGSALTILSGIADEERARLITENQVSEPFGTPCIYPNLKDQYPYHNDATWPFVQGYWLRACAQVGNEEGILHSIAALYRGAALWLSNEENYEISTGDYQLTKLNSPRQLWSVAAQAAIVPAVYFGMQPEADGMKFHPAIPKALKGTRHLSNYHYRQATLDLTISGYGNLIEKFLLDGEPTVAYIPGDLEGDHIIEITLADNAFPQMGFTLLDNAYLPITPKVEAANETLAWKPTEGAVKYQILRNGKVIETTSDTTFTTQQDGEYAVRGVAEDGTQGYISEPVNIFHNVQIYGARNYGKPDGSYLDLTRTKNTHVTIPIDITAEGLYSISWIYSNGAGPVNTANKCATRLMHIDDQQVAVVFPQRGNDEWNNWGESNIHTFHLTPGRHNVTLEFTEQTENMNFEFNCAHLDKLVVTRVE